MIELDDARLTVLLPVLGEARLLALAGELAAGLRNVPTIAADERGKLLHRLRGGAASLGFPRLAERLAAAEAAAPGDRLDDLDDVADRLVLALRAWLHDGPVQR